ncbi:MAG: FtsH protease activity modulator HflK [Pseudomonadota bacterium]|nr:FtsH protease activity modulator HflK [Pseudomonadota bacterium]
MPPNDPQWGRKDPEGPPDLDEILQRLQRRLRHWAPGLFSGRRFGGGSGGGSNGAGLARLAGALVLVLVLIWLASGMYIVDAGKVGMILRFGRLTEVTQAGPHWHWPWPIEAQAEGSPLNVEQVRSVEIGYRGNISAKASQESLMLTDDENIVDVQFAVQYTVKDPQAFLFNNRAPEEAVRQAAETAIREVVGRNKMDVVLYEGRTEIAANAGQLMQKLLDRYGTGVAIVKVNMQNAQPPEQVQAAFDDAVKAGQDRERKKNEGQAYANNVIPSAQGDAARLLAEANGYGQRVVARAQGDASRFKQVYAEYQKAPDVTRQRLYLDMMQQVLSSTTKVVAEQKQGSVLYLPLDKLIQAGGEPAAVAGAAAPAAADTTGRLPPAPASTPLGTPQDGSSDSAGRSGRDGRDIFRSRERESRP